MWDPLLQPGLTLLDGRATDLAGFLQEVSHHALHTRSRSVLWCDGDHGFNPHEFAELNLTRGFDAEDGGERLLVKRCLTPFQWYTTLSRLLPDKIRSTPTGLAIVHPFDRPFSTDELADWEQEDYVCFIIPHLHRLARDAGVPVLLGVDLARWWRTHPVLAQATQGGVDARWRIAKAGGRWRAVRDDGAQLDPMRHSHTTLLDYLEPADRPILAAPLVARARSRRTRIVHPGVDRRPPSSSG